MQSLFLGSIFLLAFVLWTGRHRVRALIYLTLGLLAARYWWAVQQWVEGLGSDSFSEAQIFALDEAWFYLGTLRQVLRPMEWLAYARMVGVALAITLGVLALCWLLQKWWIWRRKRSPAAPRLAKSTLFIKGVSVATVLCFLVSAGVQGVLAKAHFQFNSDLYEVATHNFDHEDLQVSADSIGPHDLRVVVYIGESTTSMAWSLYGYGRDTTPGLQGLRNSDPGLLVFRDVASTQVGTSPSLMEALSIELDPRERYAPIFERHRLSLVEIMNRLSIPGTLLSSQGATGSYNLASSIIFRDLSSAEYSAQTGLLGNQATYIKRVPDDQYFKGFAQTLDDLSPRGPAVLFLHSYAGHGNYRKNIPAWARKPVDGRLDKASLATVFGDQFDGADLLAANAQGYDSAMHYVDFNLTQVIGELAQSDASTVLLYFSDHGESPYTNVGHDSSRFQHEMMRVPFLMYFNPAARQARAGLLQQFRQASQLGRPSSLAQVPATVLRLLGYRLVQPAGLYQGIGLDPESSLPPLVVRRLGKQLEYVRSHGLQTDSFAGTEDKTDPATNMWLNRRARYGNGARPALCYGDANTWGKAARGALVADCLEISLALQDGVLDAAPATSNGGGWTLRAVAGMAAAQDLQLKLQGTSLLAADACRSVADLRASLAVTDSRWILELAPMVGQVLPAACKDVQSQGVALTLRVPESLSADGTAFDQWRQDVSNQGWPADYNFLARPTDRVADVLDRNPLARWRLSRVLVEDLPWVGGVGASPPEDLTVLTSWDPNSREHGD